MAAGRLKIKRVLAPAGSYFFSVPELAFCRIVKIVREARTHYIIDDHASAVNTRVRYLSTEGKFIFDINIPFNPGEIIFIIYKDPL